MVADAGLIAHGRGEAFDYILGEVTTPPAREATDAAASHLLLASRPVISVNGNAAALTAKDLVNLAEVVRARLEVNLFYRTKERIEAIAALLRESGAREILGTGAKLATLPEPDSQRRFVDPEGILVADVVLVPLEDGDRTEALRRLGKTILAIDLNPLSRTSRAASITIVDNIVRAIPNLTSAARRLRSLPKDLLREKANSYDNQATLAAYLRLIQERLGKLAATGWA